MAAQSVLAVASADSSNTDARILQTDFSSAFNTISAYWKAVAAGHGFWHLLLDTGLPDRERADSPSWQLYIQNHLSEHRITIKVRTEPFMLLAHDCSASYSTNHVIKSKASSPVKMSILESTPTRPRRWLLTLQGPIIGTVSH